MTGLLWIKLCRDLRASWSRLLLMVIAIAISLTAFGGVLFAWSASDRETGSAYASTNPASATILLDKPIGIGQMSAIAADVRDRPGVLEAIGRTQFTSEIKVNGNVRDLPLFVQVATPADPMRTARFFVQQDTWPPSPGEIFIREDSLSLLDVAIGDTVTIEIPGGNPLRLRVADTVYDPSLSPSPQEQRGYAYLSTASLIMAGERALLNQLKIQVADPGQMTPSRDRDAIVASVGNLGVWLEREYGLEIREVQVPEPYEHPHQWQSDALLLSLLAGGAAALLLSTILVATMLNNLFSQQIPQIGIMKAIGAGTSRIGRMYLTMTLVVAAAATLLALLPAILLGRLAVENLLGFLGIEPTSLAPPWWTYVVVLAVGLGLPPLMALLPLVNVSRITVRSAIDHRGLGSKTSAAAGILSRLGRVRRFDRGLLMALRNTLRRPARFLLSVGMLVCAGMVFVAGMSLSAGVEAIGEEDEQRRTWDVSVQLARPVPADQVTTLIEQVPDVARVEGYNVVPVGLAGSGQIPLTRTYPDQGHGRIEVTAIPASATTFTPTKLIEGRWLNPDETGAVVLNQITRENIVPDIHAGDMVEVVIGGTTTEWQVAGIVEERGGGGAYVTADGFADALDQPLLVNQVRIVTDSHDERTRQAVATAVGQTLTSAGVEVESAASVSRIEAISEGHLGPIIVILLAIALPLGVVGGIGLASTMSANVLDRTREFGIMHAVGARPKTVRRIVVAEGVIIALASCLVAAIPALVLTAVLGAGLGNLFFSAPLPYRVSLPAVGIWVALVVLGAILATEAAATRASRITVREAIAYV